MPPGSVVVNLDVLEEGPAHVLSGGEALAADHLHLQGVEETLGAGVVVAIALAAHAANQIVPGQEGLILARAVLAAPVRGDQHALRHFPPPQGLLQGIADQRLESRGVVYERGLG